MNEYVLLFPTENGVDHYLVYADKPTHNHDKLKIPDIPYVSIISYPPGFKFWNPINIHVIDSTMKLDNHKLVEWINCFPNNSNALIGGYKNIQLIRIDEKGEAEKWTLIKSCPDFEKKIKVSDHVNLKFELTFDRAFLDN